MDSACSRPSLWYQPLKIRHSSTWSDDLIRRASRWGTSADSRLCHMVNAMERFLFGTQHTKYPVLISCLGWVNVWAMLNVFPNGKAACRHSAANKRSDSHITQPVSKTTLFSSHLGSPTSDIYKTSGSRDRGNRGVKGTREGALKGLQSFGGWEKTNYGSICHEGSRLIKFIRYKHV